MTQRRKNTIVVGLGFGDESKGATVDWLCSRINHPTVVRFSGGPQTAHNVVLPDGRHHTFAQFGSGTLRGAYTIHSRFSLINPFNMSREAEHLESLGVTNPFSMVRFDENALLITPIHRALNRALEVRRGENRHGSCGQGVGTTQHFAIERPDLAPRMRDIKPTSVNFGGLSWKLDALWSWALQQVTEEELVEHLEFHSRAPWTKMYMDWTRDVRPMILSTTDITELIKNIGDAGNLVLEGTQGVLLDEWYGFHPHTTWSTTTFENAETLLYEAGLTRDQWSRLGVTRAYSTRHGAGPFPTEDLTFREFANEPHNGTGVYQGAWRTGPLDLSLLGYARQVVGGVDEVGVSHLDVFGDRNYVAVHENPPVPKSAEDKEDLEYQEQLTEMLFDTSDSGPRVGIMMRSVSVT